MCVRFAAAVPRAGNMLTSLIDSDILINQLRRRVAMRAYLGDLKSVARYGCSTIVVAEVYSGMRPSEETATRQLIEGLAHFPVTTPVAEKAAELRRRLGKAGNTIALDDCLIAATALLEKATLITGNGKHYPMITDKITQPVYPL